MDYAAQVREIAAEYVARYGDDAVEIIRSSCVRAYRCNAYGWFQAWRDIGVAADAILMSRAESSTRT